MYVDVLLLQERLDVLREATVWEKKEARERRGGRRARSHDTRWKERWNEEAPLCETCRPLCCVSPRVWIQQWKLSCVITSHNPSQRGEWRGRATGRQTERLKADAARLRLSLSLVFLLSVFLSRPFASLSLSPRHNHTHLIVTLSRLNTSFHSHNPQVLLKHTLLFRVCVCVREREWHHIHWRLRQAKWVQPFWVVFQESAGLYSGFILFIRFLWASSLPSSAPAFISFSSFCLFPLQPCALALLSSFFLPCLLVSVYFLVQLPTFLPSFSQITSFTVQPFPSSTPPDFSSLLPISPPCFCCPSFLFPFPFELYFPRLFLPSFLFLSCFLSYSGLSFLLPPLLLQFLSLQSLLSLLPSLHLVSSLLPCFHLTSFVIMSPRTSYFPFIFPSLHPPSVLLSSLHSFMSCSLSLQYLFCCSSFWILFTSPYPSYFHYFLHFLSSLFPLFRLWLFTFFLHQCFFTLFSS